LAIPLIGLIIRIGGKFLPLPGGLSCALAFNLCAIVLVLDAWIGKKPTTTVGAPNLLHGFSPQETISDNAKQANQSQEALLEKHKYGRIRGSRATWKQKDFACAK
jgi:hypothetical protein